MGRLYLKENMFLFISSLVLMCSAAERQYFRRDWRNLTWAEARRHCQVCFKELVTVTPDNIKTISQNLTSDSWVGLRKTFSTDNSSMSWSRWADGEPLIFQNWYPGWPVFKSSLAKMFCLCNCPERTATTTTGFTRFTESTTPDVTNYTRFTESTTPDVTNYTSFTESTNPDVTNYTSFTESTNPDVTNYTSFTESTNPDVTNYTSFTESTTPDVTNYTSFTESTTPDVTNYTSFTESTNPDVTNFTSFTESTTPDVTNYTSFTESTTPDVTNYTSFTESTNPDVTNYTSFTESTNPDVTNYTSFTESTTPDVTNYTRFTESTTPDVTSFTSFTESTNPDVTNYTSFTESTNPDVTNYTSFTESTNPDVTNYTSFTESTNPDVTNYTSFTESTNPDVTNVTSFTESTNPDVTNVTSFTESTNPDVTNYTSFTESTSPDVTSFSGPGEDATANATDMSSFTTDVTDQTVTDHAGLWKSTQKPTTAAHTMPVMSECVRSPMLSPDDPETTTNYIEDSCVAMLSFGAWVEKNCAELLSFICYEDRFFGQATVTNTTSESAILTWLPGPGDIDHYRVEVEVDRELKQFQTNNLTYDLVNLTAGTHYSVQVFPVKCGRDLDPQETAFYTTPNKVENLIVTDVTESSVFLRWKKPLGNATFYLIEVQGGEQIQSNTKWKEVGSLTPGNLYTFTVLSGVGGSSTLSEGTNITTYTKPGKVSDLKVSNNTVDSLLLKWERPEGNATGFRVTAVTDRVLFDKNVSQTEVEVTSLPHGTMITLSVTALTANNTLEGDKVTVVGCTAPRPISNLILETTSHSLTATWNSSAGNTSSFIVELQLDGELVNTPHNLTEPRKRFDGLKAAANYTVMVSTFSGHLTGRPVARSKFTRLLPPTDARGTSSNKSQITFQWTAPENIAKVRYYVRIHASFWGYEYSTVVDNQTSYTFVDLKPGTKYTFEVRLEVNGERSAPAVASHFTVAEKREISLSMSCSSAESLLCDKSATRDSVFTQLGEHFKELLGDSIFWKLEKLETESKGSQEA